MSTFDITLKWWWVLLLLPIPLAVRLFFTGQDASQLKKGALKVPFFTQFSTQFSYSKPRKKNKHLGKEEVLLTLSWFFLLFALARPTLVGEKIPLSLSGRDIMIAIDLSGSMAERDLDMANAQADRLTIIKKTADQFIDRREGDRIGLIFFSDRAYLQAPLTFDRKAVRELLDEASVGLTGQRTAIGDAITIGLKRLRESFSHNLNSNKQSDSKPREDSQVLILFTDGANNAGITSPEQATDIAIKLGVKIYTIGVGGKGRVINTPFGQRLVHNNDLDETSLRRMSQTTGGRYFRATDLKELEKIYGEIDTLEPVDRKSNFLRPEIALYYYPALFSLLFFMLILFIPAISKLESVLKRER